MYKIVLFPSKENPGFEIPEEFYGKKVEVIVTEVGDQPLKTRPIPPGNKIVTAEEILKDFGANPDFPSIEEIRAIAWPSKW